MNDLYYRSLFAILAVAVLLSGCITCTRPLVLHRPLFEEYQVVTDSVRRQTVLTGFLLGGAFAELAVIGIDENNNIRLCVYGFNGDTWVLVLDPMLSPELLFVDMANIGGRDRLITYESRRLNWFDIDSATEQTLVQVATNYHGTRDDGIPHIDISRDVNGDGRDDLVIPDADGFWISTQRINGTFTDMVKLGPPEPFLDETVLDDGRSYGEMGITALTIPWYQSRVHEMDYDQDGRSDLVFWNKDHFEVYLQGESGLFAPVPETFTTSVPFDTDGTYSLMFRLSDENTLRLILGLRGSKKRTVLHSFRDINGDSVADLVTQSLEGRSLLRQRSLYEVHFGMSTDDGTFNEQHTWIVDLNRDGKQDLLLLHWSTSEPSRVTMLVAR